MEEHTKPKLNYEEQIRHMKEKGITFNLICEEDAKLFLSKNNYYFKLTSYRINYPKINGKYQNLDFSYLIDLSIIDTELRELIIELSLDVEHAIKVKLLHLITSSKAEDGYEIVKEFYDKYPRSREQVNDFLQHDYHLKDLYQKRKKDMPIWVIMEIFSMGSLSKFVDFYFNRQEHKEVKVIKQNLKFAKNMRNMAAHGNPILINLFNDREFVPKPTGAITAEAAKMGIKRKIVQDKKMIDLVALFFLCKKFSSEKVRNHCKEEGQIFMERINRHPDYYSSIQIISVFKNALNNMVDFL
ncbi:Abi family protein [Oenococcus sp. UCMA 14587]|nr:Abi family protein [Oenococcus sp. UCMA 14587]